MNPRKYNIYRVPSLGTVVDGFKRKSFSNSDTVRIASSAYEVTSTQSKLILPQNTRRKYLLIQNLSGDTIYVNVGSPASQTPQKGVAVFTNGNYEFTPRAPEDSIHILGTLASQVVVIFEGQ